MSELFDQLVAKADQPFSGWDFSYVSGAQREIESPLPWSYASLLLPYLWRVESMLDMGTGGGEFLSRLQPLPPRTAATEGYPPNVSVAQGRLEPLGVKVHEVVHDASLPFADNEFDLVINRHESYSATELARITRPGGHFITQQVGGETDNELNRGLGAPEMTEYLHWNLAYAVEELEGAGFAILHSVEAENFTRFYDIGAIVFYLQAIPWQVEDFSVDRYRDALLRMHHHIQTHGYIDIPGQRFIIIARNG